MAVTQTGSQRDHKGVEGIFFYADISPSRLANSINCPFLALNFWDFLPNFRMRIQIPYIFSAILLLLENMTTCCFICCVFFVKINRVVFVDATWPLLLVLKCNSGLFSLLVENF